MAQTLKSNKKSQLENRERGAIFGEGKERQTELRKSNTGLRYHQNKNYLGIKNHYLKDKFFLKKPKTIISLTKFQNGYQYALHCIYCVRSLLTKTILFTKIHRQVGGWLITALLQEKLKN